MASISAGLLKQILFMLVLFPLAAMAGEGVETSYGSGHEQIDEVDRKGRVTGIGGVFFLASRDHKALQKWYAEHLGIEIQSWGGGLIDWRTDAKEDGGLTVWHVAAPDSKWFEPSDSRFMINYRVDDMDALLARLKAAGIEIIDGPQFYENGVFAWTMDPEGNKIELWQPMEWDEKNKRPAESASSK